MCGFVRFLFGGDPLSQGVALACGSAPGAAASYVLARQMGGDAPLMAGIVAFTTLASVVTIPLLLLLFIARVQERSGQRAADREGIGDRLQTLAPARDRDALRHVDLEALMRMARLGRVL